VKAWACSFTRQRATREPVASRPGPALAVRDDETTASAVAFLDEAVAALSFKVTHVLTDRGSCFTADAFEHACKRHGVQHRMTRPYTPRTNGIV
jgi:transposase InsO family protein